MSLAHGSHEPTLAATIEILEALVGFDTTSRNSNLELIAWVREYLERNGIAYAVIPSPDRQKANLLATIGPADQPGFLLSGHTDVVPVDGQDWATDPFRLARVGGRLYGRGTSDMKGYVACMLALAPRLQAARLRQPVHLAFSYDEEVGCHGVHGIVAHMQAHDIHPAAAFVGEPSDMGVVNAHKGSRGLLTRLVGLSCHSSRTDVGVNAILHAGTIIAAIADRAAALAAAPDSVGLFEPPYTTTSIGVIRGGTVRNTVAGDCEFEWDIRGTGPGLAEQVQAHIQAVIDAQVLPAMRARHAAATVTTDLVYDVPPLVVQPDNAAEALAKHLSGNNGVDSVPYGSEAGVFQNAGCPTVICGPGNIAQAHTPDEFIEIAELEKCLAFMQRLLDHASAT